MKRLLVLFIPFLLHAEIKEIHSISTVREYLDPNTLVIFDIDNTIMETAQTLGSDQWFGHRLKHYLNRNYTQAEALEVALAEWIALQHLTAVRLVEPEVATLIQECQQAGQPLIGLTIRNLGMSRRTLEQLQTLGIDLSLTAPISEEKLLFGERPLLFRQGILFTAGTDKGKAFSLLFESSLPSKVVAIDDKEIYLKQLEAVCEQHQIGFLGLRYAYLDDKVRNFSNEIASKQWEHFARFLSDEEASILLKD